MEQNRPVPRRALSPKERRRRHRIRLVRNWTVFLLSCGAVMAVMTGGILWLLPRAYALIAPPTAFEAREYEGGAETDLSDKRLMLVNANLPLTEEPTPSWPWPMMPPAFRWKPRLPQPTAKWPRPQSRMR